MDRGSTSLLLTLLLIQAAQTASVPVTCPAPGVDPNRYVEESEIATPGTYLPEDWIWFSCKPGYTLQEDQEEITCNDQGQWEPLSNPQCRPASCRLPVSPPHGRLTGEEVTPGGGTLEVSCDERYEVNGRATLECVGPSLGTDLGWDRETPGCYPVVCPDYSMVNLENGRIVMTGNRIGDTLTAVCEDGYTLRGPTTRNCTASASWSGSLQTCQDGKTTCEDPGTPISGHKTGSSYNTGDEVEFTCESNTVMFGSSNRTCLINGHWSGKETRCMGRREALNVDEATKQIGKIVRVISEETRESDEIYKEMKAYKGKEVIYGDTIMSGVNFEGRTSLQRLRNSEGLDLYFLIDTSGSIKKEDMNFTGRFIEAIVDMLGVSSDVGGTRITLTAFNNTVWKSTLPSESSSAQLIKNIVRQIVAETPKGGTSLEAAFKHLQLVQIPDAKRESRNAPSAVVIITDGLSNIGRSPVDVGKDMKNQYLGNIEFYCIGVGNANKKLLKELATGANKELQPEHLIFVKERQTLDVIMTLVTGEQDYSHCGIAGNTKLSKGIRMEEAEHGAWPWMAAIFRNSLAGSRDHLQSRFIDTHNKHSCGATLFMVDGSSETRESKYLLSAAHCFSLDRHPHKYIAKLGTISIAKELQPSESTRVIFPVKRVFIHGGFKSATLENDIAIVELNASVSFRGDIRPICLPKSGEDYYKQSKIGVVTGWGRTHVTGQTNEKLKQLHVAVQDTEECKRNITTNSKVDQRWNFCAGGLKDEDGNTMDACQGDSGGPLIMWDKDPKTDTDIFTQTGIVSFGDECGATGKPGVYTSVSKFVGWIKATIECMERNPGLTYIQQHHC